MHMTTQTASMIDPNPIHGRTTLPVIGAPIDALSTEQAIRRISEWGRAGESRYVCICNVHSVVTASQDPAYQQVIANADMATPDGAPVAWMLRRMGAQGQTRVSGPDLMLDYCEHAARTGESIFLFGSTQNTLDDLTRALQQRWPALRIAGALSPPFRASTAEEDAEYVHAINASGAGTVWVSLGCPKQERWMAEHRGRINAVMIGVGAAFDFHAGTMARAPAWMRSNGLEWLHRLICEPRRLWKRYLLTNTAYLIASARQLLRARA
ncbi:MAG: hypothetical protein RIQ60_2285 [Pseudomonadota bacterium]|jgi:N-acetylglucosaminyldiphosphoundecaprenol N-acetyl-beta-D-mannosaminyltransferase